MEGFFVILRGKGSFQSNFGLGLCKKVGCSDKSI